MFETSAPVIIEPAINIVNNADHTNKSNSVVLKGGFSTGDYSYKFKLNWDGTGKIFYSDFLEDSEEILHEVNVQELAVEIEETIRAEIDLQSQEKPLDDNEIETIRENIYQEKLEEVFWEEINQTLEDSFFRSFYDESEWGEEFACECGTVEEFEAFLELCVLTEREIGSPDDYLLVKAETEFEEAGLSECSYHTKRLEELVDIACEYYKPSGFRFNLFGKYPASR